MPEWHHAPIHRLKETGAYSVTGSTYLKQTFFHSRRRLDMLQDLFFSVMKEFGWWLQVWSLFPNHYHFVGFNDHDPTSLSRAIQEFHSASARELNRFDGEGGRQIWFQYWDTRLTTAGSYLARLRYVQENAVHHGLVTRASDYRWCSARWFERNASRAFALAVARIRIDRVRMYDDFQHETGT